MACTRQKKTSPHEQGMEWNKDELGIAYVYDWQIIWTFETYTYYVYAFEFFHIPGTYTTLVSRQTNVYSIVGKHQLHRRVCIQDSTTFISFSLSVSQDISSYQRFTTVNVLSSPLLPAHPCSGMWNLAGCACVNDGISVCVCVCQMLSVLLGFHLWPLELSFFFFFLLSDASHCMALQSELLDQPCFSQIQT